MERERVRLSGRLSTDRLDRTGDDPFNDLFRKSFEQKPIWTGLYESIHDAAFPPKLPPLELTSTPVPTPDRMAVKTNPWAIGTATIANGCLLAIVILLGLRSTINHLPKSPADGKIHLSDFTLFAPASHQYSTIQSLLSILPSPFRWRSNSQITCRSPTSVYTPRQTSGWYPVVQAREPALVLARTAATDQAKATPMAQAPRVALVARFIDPGLGESRIPFLSSRRRQSSPMRRAATSIRESA